MLLIDGIQNVTMANGIVRIQVVQTGADGKSKGVEEIAIPASQYGNVVQALQQAVQKQAGQKKPSAGSAKSSGRFRFYVRPAAFWVRSAQVNALY